MTELLVPPYIGISAVVAESLKLAVLKLIALVKRVKNGASSIMRQCVKTQAIKLASKD